MKRKKALIVSIIGIITPIISVIISMLNELKDKGTALLFWNRITRVKSIRIKH